MSTQDTPTPKKRGRNPVEIHKVRPSISLDPSVVDIGRRMAFDAGMSFSGWLEQLLREKTAEAAK